MSKMIAVLARAKVSIGKTENGPMILLTLYGHDAAGEEIELETYAVTLELGGALEDALEDAKIELLHEMSGDGARR